MSLQLPPKRKDISVRSDPNIQTTPGIKAKEDPNVPIHGPMTYGLPFQQGQHYSARSIYDFTQKIMYDWFPKNNFTTQDISGTLDISGENLAGIEFKVLADQVVSTDNSGAFFTTNKDTTSAWVFIKGNLTIDTGMTLTPPARKLFTVVYVSGDLTFNDSTSTISMTRRGANHSGTGESGGYVAPVPIRVGNNTTIAAAGGAGAATNTSDGTAVAGTNGSTTATTLGTGGGGGGWNDYKTAT